MDDPITSHRASSTSTRWHFAFGAIRICSVYGHKLTYVYVVIASKPVRRLQIRPIVHN